MDYSKFFNPALDQIKPSGIRKFFDIAATMDEVYSLGIGEPDFVTPEKIRNVAIQALKDGETSYSTNYGMIELRESIADYLHKFNLNYDPKSEILVTVGGSEGIDLSMRAFCMPGDEVILPEPAFVSYKSCILMTGATVVPLETTIEEGFKVTPEKLEALITPKTKMIVLNFPSNPTGVVMSKEELQAIADICIKHNILVLSDEIYAELSYDGHEHVSIASLPGMKERTILVSGFAKAFAMTGFRMGYLCAPVELIKPIAKVHQFALMCAQTIGQRAAAFGMREAWDDVHDMVAEYAKRRELIVRRFREMGLELSEPKGAFYVFPSIKSTGLSSDEFCNRLLEEQHVACIPGNAFGDCGEGYIRCSYATSYENIEIACDRMEKFINSLKK